MPHVVVRSVQEKDLKTVLDIAKETGPGFNSLPNNPSVIGSKIACSIASFTETLEVNKRFYFFVMEESDTQAVIGTAGIDVCIGHPWPFYKFKVSRLTQASEILNYSQEHAVLHLTNDHNDATELGTLYVKPAYRGGGRGTLLSRARCLFIAVFPHFFSHSMVADMRGISNLDGISPFWDAVGKRFFGMTYQEASYLKATKGFQVLADLLPHYPLYADFFSLEARKSIGKTHEFAVPALHILTEEGFVFRNYIDLFDAGPTIEITKSELKTVRHTARAPLKALKKKVNADRRFLISNTKLDFRATLGLLELTPNGEAILESSLAEILNVSIGENIAYCPF